ncbi:MAG: DnaJ domain-containing protein [Planctomycetota bacterium]
MSEDQHRQHETAEGADGDASRHPDSATENPFEILGLPMVFDLSRADLQRAYLTRAARHHPDRYSDPEQRHAAEVMSARLNRAQRTLIDEERRADALVVALGGPRSDVYRDLPDGFLMDIFEVRQELEEAIEDDDSETKSRLAAWAAEERARYIREISRLFASATSDKTDKQQREASLREVREQLNAWRYIERMMEQIDN